MPKHALLLVPALILAAPLSSFSQALQPPPGGELAASRERILRDARALGIPAYEEMPVYAAGSQGAAAAAALPYRRPVFELSPVPEPQPAAPAPQDNTMPKGSVAGYAVVAYHAVAAAIADSGLLFWRDTAPGFDEISRRVGAAVRASGFAPRRAGDASLLEDENFIRELEAVSGAPFLAGNTAEHLIDGPAAFAVKDRLIKNAKRTIRIASYAFYDDVTGTEAAEMLLERRRAGVDVKVMVDDKMAHIFGKPQLRRMAEGGIDVLRYRDPDRAHDYLHMKILVVDGESAVIGGMNYGDPYSHKGNGLKWRDTDVLYTGPAAAETGRLFAREWNLRVKGAGARIAPPAVAAGSGGARIAVLQQNPPSLTPPILSSILKAMAGATRRINIENAYIVAIPAFNEAVLAARARGVEVNILTNSKESIDSDGKSMADNIVQGTKVFAAAGANVYLKRGDTLHSKFMTVDGVFANIGSYNLHPRSERYDTELNVNILDRDSTALLDAAFERDIAEAQKVTLEDLNRRKPGLLSRILGKVGFSQLSRRL